MTGSSAGGGNDSRSAGPPAGGQIDPALADLGASPSQIDNTRLRHEAQRAIVWCAIIGLFVLAIYISQPLLVIFGAMVFAAMIDGGARLLGRVAPISRTIRVLIVCLLATVALIGLVLFAGMQISREAAAFPEVVERQLGEALTWAQAQGFDISQQRLQNYTTQIMSGVGTISRAVGGVFGALTTLVLIVIIGVYVALEPRLYERGLAWMFPTGKRQGLHTTMSRMAFTMRRLMAGRLLGMAIEGVFTWVMLAWYGVPLAALLAILTGLLAFIPNIGAFIAGGLMILVGFSGGVDMGLYTILVYFLVQTIDGYILVPIIARKTVDLAPALVLAAQLIMGILFGILGLFLADPLLAMIKVALERRSEAREQSGAADANDGTQASGANNGSEQQPAGAHGP